MCWSRKMSAFYPDKNMFGFQVIYYSTLSTWCDSNSHCPCTLVHLVSRATESFPFHQFSLINDQDCFCRPLKRRKVKNYVAWYKDQKHQLSCLLLILYAPKSIQFIYTDCLNHICWNLPFPYSFLNHVFGIEMQSFCKMFFQHSVKYQFGTCRNTNHIA